MFSNNSNFFPKNFDIFVGIDVDKRKMVLTFLSADGFIRSLSMPYGSEPLIRYVRRHFPDHRIAFVYEAGPTGYGLYDQLTANNYTCLVTPPSTVPCAPSDRVKTNRLDSVKLAEGLRAGQLKAIHVPCGCYRELRHLTSLRETCVNRMTASKLQIKSLLLLEGIVFPGTGSRTRQWSAASLQQLQALPCQGAVNFKLHRLLERLAFHKSQTLAVTREIWSFCDRDGELRKARDLLATIPGIGKTTAAYLLARTGGCRIRNSRQLAHFIGLVPREHSTGDTARRGHITRAGDRILRSKLIQAAWVSIRHDPELKEFYQRILRSNPAQYAAQKAVVAVARKLTARIYAVLKSERPYLIRELVNQ